MPGTDSAVFSVDSAHSPADYGAASAPEVRSKEQTRSDETLEGFH